MLPLGILALKGLCTGHEVLGPHREEGPGNGTELKLFDWLLQGLHNGGGGNEPWSDVIDGPCASIGIWWGMFIDEAVPGPVPWWHIIPPQLGIGHCPPLFIPALLQYGSTMKLSWLPEHFSNLDEGGGDDCREWIFSPFFPLLIRQSSPLALSSLAWLCARCGSRKVCFSLCFGASQRLIIKSFFSLQLVRSFFINIFFFSISFSLSLFLSLDDVYL